MLNCSSSSESSRCWVVTSCVRNWSHLYDHASHETSVAHHCQCRWDLLRSQLAVRKKIPQAAEAVPVWAGPSHQLRVMRRRGRWGLVLRWRWVLNHIRHFHFVGIDALVRGIECVDGTPIWPQLFWIRFIYSQLQSFNIPSNMDRVVSPGRKFRPSP